MTSVWLAHHVALISTDHDRGAPLIRSDDVRPILDDLDLWDMWPLALRDGTTADVAGGELWMILCAPRLANPDLRHDLARIRLLYRLDGVWRDCGYLLPEGLSPGTREWSGSATLDPDGGRVTLFYTATGRPGNPSRHFEQRLFQTTGQLDLNGVTPVIAGWSTPAESVVCDGDMYVRTDLAPVEPGFIKGFRDPGYFRDPVNGREYLLFAGSLNRSPHRYNGAIGVAQAGTGSPDLSDWSLLPPLVTAEALCNELERPHAIRVGGVYYLFWSSQASAFAPDGPVGPTGLYGMVAPSLMGPYRPLNESGLVIGNPAEAPYQAFCWCVTDDLRVHSFVDRWGPRRRPDTHPTDRTTRPFGGTLAPVLHLELEGDRAFLVR